MSQSLRKMKFVVLLLLPILALSRASGHNEFHVGLEPEEIMKVEIKPEDVTEKGMAETLKEAEGANTGMSIKRKASYPK